MTAQLTGLQHLTAQLAAVNGVKAYAPHARTPAYTAALEAELAAAK